MKTRIQLFLFLFIIPISMSSLQAQDTLRTRKNVIEVEFLGNNYFSPFSNYGGAFYYYQSRFSFASLNYSRIIPKPHTNWQFSLGLSVCSSGNNKGPHLSVNPNANTNPLILCLPFGFLWRPSAKQNGLWMGLFFNPAIGKQSNYVEQGGHLSGFFETIKFDYQITPNLCYRFRTTKKGFVAKISFTPKISSFFIPRGYHGAWGVIPWFGVSFGWAY